MTAPANLPVPSASMLEDLRTRAGATAEELPDDLATRILQGNRVITQSRSESVQYTGVNSFVMTLTQADLATGGEHGLLASWVSGIDSDRAHTQEIEKNRSDHSIWMEKAGLIGALTVFVAGVIAMLISPGIAGYIGGFLFLAMCVLAVPRGIERYFGNRAAPDAVPGSLADPDVPQLEPTAPSTSADSAH